MSAIQELRGAVESAVQVGVADAFAVVARFEHHVDHAADFGIEGSGALNWTVTAGDPAGIGPEIVAEAVKVLDQLAGEGLALELDEGLIGGSAYDTAGTPLPEATLDMAREADAILLGAVGGEQNRDTPLGRQLPAAGHRKRRDEPDGVGIRLDFGPAAGEHSAHHEDREHDMGPRPANHDHGIVPPLPLETCCNMAA